MDLNINNFKIGRLLGFGSHSRIYFAKFKESNKVCAIKIISEQILKTIDPNIEVNALKNEKSGFGN